MRRAAAGAAVLAALGLAGSATQAAPLPSAIAFARAEPAGGGIFVLERSGRARLLTGSGAAPTWSADGRRLAYVAPSPSGSTELYVVDANGTHRAPLTRTRLANEVMAAWARDGRSLVVERDEQLVVVRADGRAERFLTAGRDPAWSVKGRIAFVSDRDGIDDLYVVAANGRGLRRLTATPGVESEPAWSPDGTRLAFVSLDGGLTDLYVLDIRTRAVVRLTEDAALEGSPVWAQSGDRIAFVGDRAGGGPLWSISAAGGVATSLGGPAGVERFRWRPAVSAELPPDLDQQPPADLSLRVSESGGGRRYLLGFTSASDNVGEGPLSIVASRPSHGVPTMQAAQRVRVGGGEGRTYRRAGFLRYTVAFPHRHWHLMDFQRYELRRASDHVLVARDRKSGFCLADHWGLARSTVPGKPRRPVFRTNCGQGDPHALSIAQGTSVGFTDRYPAHFHGQNLDVTGVPAGTYVLVHRSNANLRLRELRYENNAASLRVRLSWPRGRRHAPAIRLLAICATSEWCPG